MFEPMLPPPTDPKSIRNPIAAARFDGFGTLTDVHVPTIGDCAEKPAAAKNIAK